VWKEGARPLRRNQACYARSRGRGGLQGVHESDRAVFSAAVPNVTQICPPNKLLHLTIAREAAADEFDALSGG
jgi:hypothetical protein